MIGIPRQLSQAVSFQQIIRLDGVGYIGNCCRIRSCGEAVFAGSVHTPELSASRAGMIQDTIFRNAFFIQQM